MIFLNLSLVYFQILNREVFKDKSVEMIIHLRINKIFDRIKQQSKYFRLQIKIIKNYKQINNRKYSKQTNKKSRTLV
jgi:hypothetical protein